MAKVGQPRPMAHVDAHRPCACETISVMQSVARATDYHQSIGGTYLPRASQRGRAVSCESEQPCACHSGSEESMPTYACCTLQDLTTCMHSISATKAKMAARSPPTPPPHVTATGVDSSGPIGRAQTGIDFCPRMGYDWAYLKRAPTQSHSSGKDRLGAPVR